MGRREGAGRVRDGGGARCPCRREREKRLGRPPILDFGGKIVDFTVWRFLFGGLAGGNVILGLVASKFGGRLKFD